MKASLIGIIVGASIGGIALIIFISLIVFLAVKSLAYLIQ